MSSSIKAVLKPHVRDIGNLAVRRVLPAMAAHAGIDLVAGLSFFRMLRSTGIDDNAQVS